MNDKIAGEESCSLYICMIPFLHILNFRVFFLTLRWFEFLSDFTKLYYQVNYAECLIVLKGLPLTFHITVFSPSLPIVISVHPEYNRSWLPQGAPGRAFPAFPIIGVCYACSLNIM